MPATLFTPVEALIGGSLIGLSAVVLMLFLGRIMGISGILGGLFEVRQLKDYPWRLAFLIGVLAAPLAYILVWGQAPTIDAPSNLILMAIAGLLVGFGATTGSGCTSGHGICGMARFSRRSITAVGVFMATAFVTVYLTRHVFGGVL